MLPAVSSPTAPSPSRWRGRLPRETLFLVALALLLLTPFALSKLHPALEPFPAVMLPSGANLTRLDDEIRTFTVAAASARRPGETAWERIDPVALVDPVLPQYFNSLAARGFGLDPLPPQELHLRRLGQRIVLPDRHSDARAAETAAWLRARLGQLGYSGDALRITRQLVRYRSSDFQEIDATTVHEAIHQLD